MNFIKSYYFQKTDLFILLVLLIVACKAPQESIRSIKPNNTLINTATTFINHLNNRNFSELPVYYAEHFEGLSPIVTFTSKTELLASIKQNYSSNKNIIQANILEQKTGTNLGYIVFRWKLKAPLENGEWEVILDKNMLSIWELNKDGQWQISRMLFYNEIEGYGVGK